MLIGLKKKKKKIKREKISFQRKEEQQKLVVLIGFGLHAIQPAISTIDQVSIQFSTHLPAKLTQTQKRRF